MARFILRFLIILSFLILNINIDGFEAKPNSKNRHNHQLKAKCTSEFLWEALIAASKGNRSSTNFLATELDNLGFTKDGIRPRSVAAHWQSKTSGIKSQSLFSNLQKLGAVDLQPVSYCEQCESQPDVEIISTIQSRPNKLKSDLKHLIKAVNKIFENSSHNYEDSNRRNKKLRRLLKRFVLSNSFCADKMPLSSTTEIATTTTEKPQVKENGLDSTNICLLLIKELMEKGICEQVNESFQWTFQQIEDSFRKKTTQVPVIITAKVP